MRREAEQRASERPREEVVPSDSELSAEAVHAEAVRQLELGEHAEAAWGFLVALFLDWAFNTQDKLRPAKRAIQRCKGPVADALRPMFSNEKTYDRYEHALNAQMISRLWEKEEADSRETAKKENRASSGSTSKNGALLATENRARFACACCAIFLARDLSSAFSQTRDRQFAYEAQRFVAKAAELIEPEKYLTLMFELAYSNRAIHAVDEGTRWSKLFQQAVPRQPNAHWKCFLELNRQGQRNLETAVMGTDPAELLNKCPQQ